ncbi:MAG: TfoX/Sxy family protein [Alphaproteobacteria bacterium]
MAASAEFCQFVLDLLQPLGRVTARRMFGGYGLYFDGRMFALIADDTLYLKADDRNRPFFEVAGMPPFRPSVGGRTMTMPYYRAPPDILEDSGQLSDWARASVTAALDSPPKSRPKKAEPKKAETHAGKKRKVAPKKSGQPVRKTPGKRAHRKPGKPAPRGARR